MNLCYIHVHDASTQNLLLPLLYTLAVDKGYKHILGGCEEKGSKLVLKSVMLSILWI